MEHLDNFEENQNKERSSRMRPARFERIRKGRGKHCLGKCNRKVIDEGGGPVIYCGACDRYIT